MTQPAGLKEDKILVSLEKGHLWFEDHWKKVFIFTCVLILTAVAYAYISGQQRKHQSQLWNDAASAKTIEEKTTFLQSHPDAEAARPMTITLAREELDKGLYEKARDHLNMYISKYPKDEMLGTAYLLRGYAHEELDKVGEARQDFARSAALPGMSKPLADLSLARLQQN